MARKLSIPPPVAYAFGAALGGIALSLHWMLHDPWGALLVAAIGGALIEYGVLRQFGAAPSALAEQRLALAQKNTGVGIFELDFEAGTAFVTPSMCRMLGLEVAHGEINLEHWLGSLRAGHVEESRRVMQDYIARGELRYEREQRIERPDGDIRWVLNRVELEATPAGALRVARGVAVDITERKRVDELLQRAQAGLRQQLQDVGRLHAFSQSLVAAGDDIPTVLRSLLEVIVELYGAAHGMVTLRNPRDGSFQVVAQAGFTDEAIDRNPAPQNTSAEYAVIEWHRSLAAQQNLSEGLSVPLFSAKGEVMGAASVMLTEPRENSAREARLAEVCAATAAAVVERERAREAAAHDQRRFSVALETSVVPFSILAPLRHGDGHIVDFEWTYVNAAAANALGRGAADLIGQAISQVLPRAWDAPGLFDRYVGMIESDEQVEFEIQTSATNHGARWYNVLTAPLEGSLAVWFTDVTGRKKYEETLHEAARRKDEFLATLAHELRNPLAPIRQGVRIAAAANATDAQRRWSNAIIERQVQHMSHLLDDLLDVSRVGRGTLLLRRSTEPLSAVLDTAVEAARPHFEAKRHRLDVALPQEPVLLDIDPVRIAQVLGNLLTNAAKYTDPGGRIHVSAKREGGGLTIRVRDNGIGLTSDQQSQVFEMFSQVPAALDRAQGGLGIGLALARGLVELHGGTIEACSAGLGRGTEVIVRLPAACVVGDRQLGPPPAQASSVPAAARPKRCILVADDNVDAADSLAELLRLEGYEVHVAYDGAEALATFGRVDFDAALLDVGMPNVSGLEVVRAIRQQPRGERATLIAITGWGQERDRRVALEAGFDHHLTKPMATEVIHDLIEQGRTREPT